MGRKRLVVSGEYGCGDKFENVWVQELPKYCKIHGDGISSQYNSSLPAPEKKK